MESKKLRVDIRFTSYWKQPSITHVSIYHREIKPKTITRQLRFRAPNIHEQPL